MHMSSADPFQRGLIVEDRSETREWLKEVLHEAFGALSVEVFSDYTSSARWLRDQAGGAPAKTIALIDLVLPDGSGATLIRDIKERQPHIIPVVISIYEDDGYLFDALAAGAQGYLLKDEPQGALIRRLREIEQGELPLSPSIARRVLDHFRRDTAPTAAATGATLTSRERDVLSLVARGQRIGEVADELHLSRNTVAGYVKAIYSKLNISSRAEAALEARRRGLI
jgi:DNA-binding NarL/FixJ family response regulator